MLGRSNALYIKAAGGIAEGKAEGEAERKRLEKEIAMLRERLMKYEGATA